MAILHSYYHSTNIVYCDSTLDSALQTLLICPPVPAVSDGQGDSSTHAVLIINVYFYYEQVWQ
jgi:hypothetical protein